jgi:3-phosphoshikimate 1-carboxyvinyltransferase
MILVSPPSSAIHAKIELPGSKSISNRLLMIRAISGLELHFRNLSDSEDTVLLAKSLGEIKGKRSATIDIHHAGTDMRFLTAYLAVTEGEWILTGSERMKQRPIGELVEALRKLGADIAYTEKEGFPPLKIKGKKLDGGRIEMDGSISSQFISALLMISTTFEKGLDLTLKGEIVSLPYITMTIELLKQFGVFVSFIGNKLITKASEFTLFNENIFIESDWSAASYWYSIVALSEKAEIELLFLEQDSLQADCLLPALYNKLGVKTEYIEKGVRLSKKTISDIEFKYDFTNCPDIAQTVAVSCLGLGIKADLSGLKTLKVKETDRLVALKNELEKFGAKIEITNDVLKLIPPPTLRTPNSTPVTAGIQTYGDHRMAMCFAPLSIKNPKIKIEHPEVVDKSYPAFWDDLEEAGFSLD